MAESLKEDEGGGSETVTLSKQIMIMVVSIFILVFTGTFLITVHNAKQFYLEQLESNAQDTATSLGLTLSNPVDKQDKALVMSMVDAIFDRGFFSLIMVNTLAGKTLMERHLKLNVSDVPNWFVNLLDLKHASKTAIIMKGWHQVGFVNVTSNPGFAYQELWKNTKELLSYYVLMALFVVLISVVLIKLLLQPLKRVTKQAQAICAKQFHIEKNIPRTWELRQVTDAMNSMVEKVKNLFDKQAREAEQLRAEAYQDKITGLGNRRFFMQQIKQLLENKEEYSEGHFLLIEINNLIVFNKKYGYARGDELIQAVSQILNSSIPNQDTPLAARLDGPSFAFIVCNQDEEHLLDILDKLTAQMKSMLLGEDACLSLSIGVVKYHFAMAVSHLLTQADIGLRYAAEKGNFSYFLVHDDGKALQLTTQQWKDKILKAIEMKNISLYAQWVKCGHNRLHREIFLRMIDENSKEIPAGQFFPIAEKYQLGHLLDALMLQRLLVQELHEPVAINVSGTTVTERQACDNFLKQLSAIQKNKRHLVSVELSENIAFSHPDEVIKFTHHLASLGFDVGLDRVGANFTPFYHLSQFQVNYLKLDGGLTRDLEDNKAKQLFLQHLVNSVETLDIQLIATNVENENQWKMLNSLGLICGQGIYLSAVEKKS